MNNKLFTSVSIKEQENTCGGVNTTIPSIPGIPGIPTIPTNLTSALAFLNIIPLDPIGNNPSLLFAPPLGIPGFISFP
ncbi:MULTISPECIES: hypothetical protein [unclassified Anabaena]|uniref:hypothetical protein n=1 Tax=unclassified Anabaena TaxID=2619674 RepID=UPI001445F184|nr:MULTISPECIES: hypothetical protein [unclassified Anabaena]MTJ10864.1 hypothetical protein [Anabaena sp. UHCC 0204]MTJ52670.1 hypothetical protein [Anabaena sp. UHCC 0253]